MSGRPCAAAPPAKHDGSLRSIAKLDVGRIEASVQQLLLGFGGL